MTRTEYLENVCDFDDLCGVANEVHCDEYSDIVMNRNYRIDNRIEEYFSQALCQNEWWYVVETLYALRDYEWINFYNLEGYDEADFEYHKDVLYEWMDRNGEFDDEDEESDVDAAVDEQSAQIENCPKPKQAFRLDDYDDIVDVDETVCEEIYSLLWNAAKVCE